MKSIGIVVGALGVVTALVAGNGAALAVESSMLVELPRKIRAEYRQVIKQSQEAEKASAGIEAQIKDVVKQVAVTDDPDAKLRLREKYLLLRAKGLKIVAEQMVATKESLTRIGVLLGQLERAGQSKDSLFGGISADDQEAKMAMAQAYKGMAKLVAMVDAASAGGTHVGVAGQTIENMNALTKDFFGKRRGNLSLQERQSYVMAMAAKMQSALNMVEWRRVELQTMVFWCEADGAIQKINQLDEVFGDGLANIGPTFDKHRETDRGVMPDENAASSPSGGGAGGYNASNWGNF